MKYRQYTINIPKDLADRLEQSLDAVKAADDRIPKDLGTSDYLALVIIPQGVATAEDQVKRRERSQRRVITSEEATRETMERWEAQQRG